MQRTLPLLLALIALTALLGLHVGIRTYSPADVWHAVFTPGDDATTLIVRNLRIPRAILSVLVGGSLGLAGLLMQSVTRNPIAEPGLLGINAGAAFAVVSVLTLNTNAPDILLMGAAAGGALGATAIVFGLAMATGAGVSPIHMLLAGVTVAAILGAGLQILILLDEAVMEELLFWLSGAFVDRPLAGLRIAVPVMGASVAVALWLARALDALQTDDVTAQSVGLPVAQIRLGLLVLVALLAGSCVALAGPVAFVGLVAPHLARLSGARGHAQLVPFSIAWGCLLTVGADITARFVLYPTEAPVSAVMAMIGVPLLIFLLLSARVRAP